jgi:transposase
MDDGLPLASLSASTLRVLLTQERARHAELEQEVARLSAAVARQNERIIALEAENAELRRIVAEQQQVIAGLQEQNALLRQQVAALQAENARLRGGAPKGLHQPEPWPSAHTKQERPSHPRKKRDRKHNRGRHRMAQVDERIEHAADACPRCGAALVGGWVHDRAQVVDLPEQQRAQVTEHVRVARHCPTCRRRVLPPPPGSGAGRIGRRRFGPRLIAAVVTMRTVERLPLGQIQARLAREYGLHLSAGGLVGLLALAAARAGPAYAAIRAQVRASPVVHSDETGWRQDGVPGYIWSASSAQSRYFHYDASRSGQVADTVLGEDFGGILVADFYAAYDHLPGIKQRCWSHLWRDITARAAESPGDGELAAWIAGVRAIYQAAMAPRPATEEGMTTQAVRRREHRARQYEQQLLLLCPEDLPDCRPEATLAKRIRRYSKELFTCVRELGVPATNNAAERALRPQVIARKISGGTRSARGSATRMVLASVIATAQLRGQDPTAACQRFLLAPHSHGL